MSLPALRALRASFPSDHLAVLARPWVAELYRLLPEPDEVLVEEKGATDALVDVLRASAFDRAVILPTSFSSARLLRRAGIPERIGARGELRSPLLTKALAPSLAIGEHQVWKHLRLVEAAGATLPERPDTSWAVAPREREAGRLCLKSAGHDGKPFVAVHAASFAHAAKRWDLSRFAAVLDALHGERRLGAVLLGSASEKAVNESLAALVRAAPIVDLSGKSSLGEVVGILAEARLFVGNDSGLSHLAAAVGTPTVVVFGPTDPDATRPWDGPRGDGRPVRLAIVRRRTVCAPCRFDVCPIDHRCLSGVTADDVLGACLALLG